MGKTSDLRKFSNTVNQHLFEAEVLPAKLQSMIINRDDSSIASLLMKDFDQWLGKKYKMYPSTLIFEFLSKQNIKSSYGLNLTEIKNIFKKYNLDIESPENFEPVGDDMAPTNSEDVDSSSNNKVKDDTLSNNKQPNLKQMTVDVLNFLRNRISDVQHGIDDPDFSEKKKELFKERKGHLIKAYDHIQKYKKLIGTTIDPGPGSKISSGSGSDRYDSTATITGTQEIKEHIENLIIKYHIMIEAQSIKTPTQLSEFILNDNEVLNKLFGGRKKKIGKRGFVSSNNNVTEIDLLNRNQIYKLFLNIAKTLM